MTARSTGSARGSIPWRGIGAVSVGMHRQGYDLQLTQYDERGWRATFYVTGVEHSLTSDTASKWEPTSGVIGPTTPLIASGPTPYPKSCRSVEHVFPGRKTRGGGSYEFLMSRSNCLRPPTTPIPSSADPRRIRLAGSGTDTVLPRTVAARPRYVPW
jgi:hypothetical protein